MKAKYLYSLGALLLLLSSAVPAQAPVNDSAKTRWMALVRHGIETRQMGNLQESIDILREARTDAVSPADRLLATAELGASLLQARQLTEAGPLLRDAYTQAYGEAKGRIANDLGNLASAEKDPGSALGFYQEAQQLGASVPEISLGARLNQEHLDLTARNGHSLLTLLPEIRKLGDATVRARYLLNFGRQAAALGGAGVEHAHAAYTEARLAALGVQAQRMEVEALDALAQLYEDQLRLVDAQTLNSTALQRAAGAPLGLVQDLLIRLEWRRSRLLKAAGHLDEALAAMQRAAAYIESIRPDLPIEVENGRTSFSTILQPVYVGLADLILQRQQSTDVEGRKASALAAINALELSRQAEMQDYLGERCTVVSETAGEQNLPSGVAVLYPLVLPDRLVLLLKTSFSASHHVAQVNPDNLRRLAADMVDSLRRYDTDDYLSPAQKLYDLLMRPLESELASANIDTLIIATDGFLRPVPLSALHDGKKFLIEKFALGTVTGMTMTDLRLRDNTVVSALMAGLSEPGPVLDKVDVTKLGMVNDIAKVNSPALANQSLQLRSMRIRNIEQSHNANDPSAQRSALSEALKLPGVDTELNSIARTMQGTSLLNKDFTIARFGQESTSGKYHILHIASHGIFGGDAKSSFILAYDDVLTMNGLQSLLNSDSVKQSPIDLLTLSACETAEGNERAPLGFAGAAIKARARSALGTLWPVADDAARQLMDTFYSGLVTKKSTKALALREAQNNLLNQNATAHPFFWAPFTLVGNWN